ncbi:MULTISPECIES: NAD(P)/FAD-dependent oxidoreductase [Roseivirga]|uniref:NAD(P)/FAD-dependent oxidoreductase n=1 Tax=Roseivirga TaxID=290180 RepID=UPI00257CEF42|nr:MULTISPECIES: FAD-dependent oxidoreductase [Roseivirga]|tara:strand:+ start:38641 stop:39894 length:1254 start_codon:yes stop_codon:yes gene_type:complete
MSTQRVLVVGAGIVGLSTAYYLQKRGLQVEIIDAGDGNNNCSFGNAGYVSPSHLIPLASPGIISQGLRWMLNPESPFYIKPRLNSDLLRWGWLFKKAATHGKVQAAAPVLRDLMVKSQHLYEQIIHEEQIDAGYKKPGLLMICKTEQTLKHEVELVEMAQKMGLEAEVLTREETERLEPAVKYDMHGSVYFACDAWMTPHQFMKLFQQKVAALGVKIHYGQTLTKLVRDNGRITRVTTQDNSFEADHVVITAGSWSPLLAKQVGLNIPLQPGKGYSFMLNNPPKMTSLPAILVEGRLATTPMQDGLRFAGTMELSGHNHDIRQNRINGIVKSIKEFMPDFRDVDFSTVKPWAGLRPCTPDGLPYIGGTKKANNLYIGTGHAMLGWTLGPVTGHLLAEQITEKKMSIQSPLIGVDRYA